MKVELNTLVCPIITPDTYGTEFQYVISEECWDDFKEMLCDIGAKYIKDAIRETKDFVKCPVLVSRKLVSPSQYNYVTDRIDFNVYVSDELVDMLKSERVSEQFLSYIKKFGSHSGFVSSYPTTEKEVMDALNDTKSNKFALVISEFIMYEVEYVMDLDDYQRDYLDEVWDTALERGFEEDEEYDESRVSKAVHSILEGADVRAVVSNVPLMERPQMYLKSRTIEVVLPNEEPFFVTLSVPGNIKNPKGYIQNWVNKHLPSNADWDYNESKKPNGCGISESKKKIDADKLEKDLAEALYDYMESEGFTSQEAKDYSGVGFDFEDGRLVINVWAEISYGGLMELADRLDSIVSKYDKNAYFEPETSGRLVCVIDGYIK